MGKDSAIEWTDATWNPWMGCTKVSAGCKNCYMFREQIRYGHDPTKIRGSKTTRRDPLKWKEPRTIFVCSWSDFAHEDVPPSWIDEAWEIIRKANHHTYMILTKRPNELKQILPDDWGEGWPHVRVGVSVENDDNMWRLVALEDIRAAVRYVSIEPLLGPLPQLYSFFPTVDWVIVGGESGPNFRPMKREWVTDIREQCIEHGIPFFFKQWAGISPKKDPRGNLLDGFEWKETPCTPDAPPKWT